MTHFPPPRSSLTVVRNALCDALGVPVSTELPTNKPERFVVLSRIGGGDGPFGTIAPRFLIECYAPNDELAEIFGEIVRDTWNTLRKYPINYTYDDDNLVPLRSPDTDHARYQYTGGVQLIR